MRSLSYRQSELASIQVLESCRVALGAHIVEGYGQTESTGYSPLTLTTLHHLFFGVSAMATITWPGEAVGGHCGGPAVCSLLKLEDVPDLNYYAVCIAHPPFTLIPLRSSEGQERRDSHQRPISHTRLLQRCGENGRAIRF